MDDITQELAKRDLQDIQTLRESEAFNRYFMRRIKKRREQVMEELLKTPLTHAELEAHRAIVNTLDDIISMADRDEVSAQRMLGG
jgi:hypothetical protein